MSENRSPSEPEQTAEQPPRTNLSRRTLLGRSLVATAAAVPVGILAVNGVQAAAYRGVARVSGGAPSGATAQGLGTIAQNAQAFIQIQNDENAHVTYIANALKNGARAKPTFKGLMAADINAFATLSRTFENVGVGAYLMAAPAISDKTILAAAGSILTIEARHAGFLDVLTGQALGPNGAFDKPMSQADIVTAVTPFVASLNGGPDPSGQLKSDTDILNFALLLEYLEAEFYNLNVPKFFGTVGQG